MRHATPPSAPPAGSPPAGSPPRRASQLFTRQLDDYRLTTAEILYHLPDHPDILQTYVWQELDLAPRYPVLRGFLDFWRRELEGRLHSVRVASAGLIAPPQWRAPGAFMTLH